MAGNAIIYITNSSLVIYRWNRHRLEEELRLFDVKKAKQLLSQYFQQYGNKPIKIVVDILEEMNSLESLPHLNARDRKSMIARKQKQQFPGLKFVYKEYKGRGSSERRDDLVLFSTITDEQLIDSWLKLLFEIEVKVSGIFSLPVLLESFVEQLQGKSDKLIISVADDKHGLLLRQSYFKNNSLVLSRFKHINELDRQQQAEEIQIDVNRSQRFVARHFNINNEDSLSVYFFGSGLGLFSKINFAAVGLKPNYLPTYEFAKTQGNEVDAECGLASYVAGLAAKKTKQKTHYKDAKSDFFYKHFLIKSAFNGISVLFIVLAVIYSIFGFNDHFSQQQQSDDLRVKRNNIVQKLANTAEIPLFKGYTPGELLNQLQVLEKVNGNRVKPEVIMKSISLVLEHFPDIRLTKLKWGAAKKQDDPMNAAAVVDPTQEVGLQDPTIITTPKLLISIQASFQPFQGDFRYALLIIEQFSAELEANDLIERVSATKLPVDISAANELSGAIKAKAINAEFILEIQWRR